MFLGYCSRSAKTQNRRSCANRWRKCTLRCERLEDRVVLSTLTWDGGPVGAGTSWQDPENWDGNVLPGLTDDVVIGAEFSGATITSSADVTINSVQCAGHLQIEGGVFDIKSASSSAKFTLANGTLSGLGDFTVNNAFTWSYGDILSTGAGKLILPATSSGQIASSSFKRLGRVLENSGVLTYRGTNFQFGPTSATPGVLNNLPAGVFTLVGDGDFSADLGAGHAFNNYGTFNRSGRGVTTFSPNVAFNNEGGTINVSFGRLVLGTGGVSHDGAVLVTANGSIDLAGHTLSGTFVGAGGGAVTLANSALTIGETGATFDFEPGMWQWTGGDLTGGPITNLGQFNISGSQTMHLGLTLDNRGEIAFSANELRFGLSATRPGVIANFGSFTATGDGDFTQGIFAPNEFQNTGTFTRQGDGTTTFGIGVAFENASGAINVTSGMLQLGSSGISDGATITVLPGATLDLSGHAVSGSLVGSGGGLVRIDGNLSIAGNGATFNFPSGMCQWAKGDLAGETLTNVGDFTIMTDEAKRLGSTLVNMGTVNYTGSLLQFGASDVLTGEILNMPGAIFNADGDGDFTQALGGVGVVTNQGAFHRSGSGTTVFGVGVRFDNDDGVIDVSEGTLQLGSSGASSGGALVVAVAATLDLSGHTVSGPFTGTGGGRIVVDGNLNVAGSGATFDCSPGMWQWLSGTWAGAGISNLNDLTISGDGVKRLGLALLNTGTITYDGSELQFGADAATPGQLINTSLFQAVGAGDLTQAFDGSHVLTNTGTFTRSGSGTTTFGVGVAFDNDSGTIHVIDGTLEVGPTGASTAVTVTVDAAAVLDLSGYSIAGTFSGTGGGTVLIASDVHITGAGAIWDMTPGLLQWASGSLIGSDLTNIGDWTISDSGAKTLGLKFINFGAVEYVGSNLLFGPGDNIAGVIDNIGTFTVTGDADFAVAHPGPHAFNSSGVFTHVGAGTSTFFPGIPFNESGIVNVPGGKFEVAGGGSATGTFTISFGAMFLTGGNFFLYNGANSTGNGLVLLAGATLRIDNADSARLARFTQRRGSVTGTGILTITHTFSWGGGVQGGGGKTIISPTAAGSFTGQSTKFLGRQLENRGTLTYDGSAVTFGFAGSPGTLENKPGAILVLTNDGGLGNNQGELNAIVNAGTIIRTGAGLTNIADFVAFTNTGTVDIQGGGLSVGNPYLQLSGVTMVANGAILQSANGVLIQGGVLSGSGTVLGNVTNAGEIHPGGTGFWGTLSIIGAYTQTSTGVLQIELVGSAPDDHDRLTVSDAVSLDGTLSVSLLFGFMPMAGNQFPILTFSAVSGDFTVYNGLDLGNGLVFVPIFTATDLTLLTVDQ